MAKTATKTLNGSQILELTAEKLGIKKKLVRDMTVALAAVVTHQLSRVGEVKVPNLGKFVVKRVPEKKYPAGEYVNPFKKGTDGKPLIEHREAYTRPARLKFKFVYPGIIRKAVKL